MGLMRGRGRPSTDASGNGNNGTIANATWAASGKYGKALQFNGTNALVTIPDSASLHLSSAMTLEAWVNPSTVNANWRDVIYKGNDNYYLEATSSNASRPDAGMIAGGSYADAFGTSALPANTWSYLTETYDGTTLRLYVNGTQVASTAHTGAIATSTNPLQIGGDSLYGQYFAGLIDEVRVYNTALTATQIQTDQATSVNPQGPDTTPPSQPGTLTATAVSGGEIDLSWGASSDNVGVTGYQLERCQGAGCSNFTQIATPTATSYKDTTVSASTSYSYRVRATDAAGNLSPYSNTATTTTPTPDTTPPSQPGTLTATAVSGGEIDLSWGASSDNVGVTGYQLERCQGAGCSNFTQIATPTATSYKDTTVTASTSYSYRVRATDAAGNLSPYSNTATTTTPSSLSIQYSSTDANGVASYNFTSSDDGGGTHVLRVLAPTNPAPGVPHNFLYVLPVEPELGSVYGDGLETLRSLDAQDKYNLTIIEPSFAIDPWYADNPNDPNLHYESFLTKDLVPWVTANLVPPAVSQPFAPLPGHEQNWLIGFSKSGIGGADLLLKHPDIFAVAASWDFPADMATYDQFGSSSANNYGTDANFQANYRLTPSFVDAHKTPFLSSNRIWIGGYNVFQTDMADYDALLTSEGIAHTTETPQLMAHRWDSGWVPIALSTMSQEGGALAATL